MLQNMTPKHRRLPRIENSPGALDTLRTLLAGFHYRRAVLSCLTDHTIDEDTVDGFAPDAARELKMYARALGEELGRPVLLPRQVLLPRLRGHARATYQLRHFDLMGEFRRALQVLEEFQLSATVHDVTPELAAWVEQQLQDPTLLELLLKHFDLSTEDTH